MKFCSIITFSILLIAYSCSFASASSSGNSKGAPFFFTVPWSQDGLSFSVSWRIRNEHIIMALYQNITVPQESLPPLFTGEQYSNETLKQLFDDHMPHRWVSLALSDKVTGKPFMINADYLFVWPQKSRNNNNKNNNGTEDSPFDCHLSDRWSNSNSKPQLDTSFDGGKDDLELLDRQLIFTAGDLKLSAKCEFQRKLITGDKYDIAIEDRLLSFGIAHGLFGDDGAEKKHDKTVRVKLVNFYKNKVLDFLPADRVTELYFWHGILMTIAFCVLMIPGTLLARYFKALVPTWYFIHWKVQVLAIVIALAATFVAAVELNWHVPMDIHVIIGLTIITLLFVQGALGYLSNALWYEGKPPQFWPDKLHWWIGRLILLGAAVNMMLGIFSYADKDFSHLGIGWTWPKVLYLIFISCLVISVGFLEFRVGQLHEHLMPTRDSAAYTPIMASADTILRDDDNLMSGDIEARHLKTQWTPSQLKTFTGVSSLVCLVLIVVFMLTLYFA